MKELLKKYSHITFTDDAKKFDFFHSIESLYKTLTTQENKKIFLDILESSLLEFSQFDKRVIYNPVEFFDALIENDLF